MISQEVVYEGADLLNRIVSEAHIDKEFKLELISSPKNAIKKLAGQEHELFKGKDIHVEDQTDSSIIYLNIPPQLNFDEIELTPEQLESVAGGCTPSTVGIIGLFIAGYSAGRMDKRASKNPCE